MIQLKNELGQLRTKQQRGINVTVTKTYDTLKDRIDEYAIDIHNYRDLVEFAAYNIKETWRTFWGKVLNKFKDWKGGESRLYSASQFKNDCASMFIYDVYIFIYVYFVLFYI